MSLHDWQGLLFAFGVALACVTLAVCYGRLLLMEVRNRDRFGAWCSGAFMFAMFVVLLATVLDLIGGGS